MNDKIKQNTKLVSALMGVNAFDQGGDELGKGIDKQIRTKLENATGMDDHEASTAELATAGLDANR